MEKAGEGWNPHHETKNRHDNTDKAAERDCLLKKRSQAFTHDWILPYNAQLRAGINVQNNSFSLI
jgi:hypothetical protein